MIRQKAFSHGAIEFHVIPDASNGWLIQTFVILSHGQRFRTQKAAVLSARCLARKLGVPLVIHWSDGRIRQQLLYR